MPGTTTPVLEYLGHLHYMIPMLLLHWVALYSAKNPPLWFIQGFLQKCLEIYGCLNTFLKIINIVCRCQTLCKYYDKKYESSERFYTYRGRQWQFIVGAVKSFPFRKQSHWEHLSGESAQSLKRSPSGLSLEIHFSGIMWKWNSRETKSTAPTLQASSAFSHHTTKPLWMLCVLDLLQPFPGPFRCIWSIVERAELRQR